MDKIEVTHQWRKKPVVVEAMKYPGHTVTGVDTLLAFEDWIEPLAKAAGRWPLTYRGQSLIIPTLEGDHEAKPGDYIIRGVSGEIYPCKPDIFAKTYEPALTTRTDATPVAWMDLLANAYSQGAEDVHKAFIGDTASFEPDFGEAASDYARSIDFPPATDVAALVEAAKETNAALERDGDPAFAHLILDNKAALAPFTKGQNDE